MGRRRKLTAADVNYAVELYKQFKAGSRGTDLVAQLAKKFAVSKMTMYFYLRQGGIYNPHMVRSPKDTLEESAKIALDAAKGTE
mgnify:CR=1 FL=1